MCMDPNMLAQMAPQMMAMMQQMQPSAEHIPLQTATPGAPRPDPEEADEPPRPSGAVPMVPGR